MAVVGFLSWSWLEQLFSALFLRAVRGVLCFAIRTFHPIHFCVTEVPGNTARGVKLFCVVERYERE